MTAVISSRTPDGEPIRCPICGAVDRIDPSRPPGDAPCPSCGHLAWFAETPEPAGTIRRLGEHAEGVLRSEPRRSMFGVRATIARQVGRVIRAARRRVLAPASPESSGVYDHWLDG